MLRQLSRRRPIAIAALALVVLALFSPQFFQEYRGAAFDTGPRDDYGPYLQYVVGQGGSLPGSPMIFRPFSVLAAVPFFFVLPHYAFSNLSNVDDTALQATEAIVAMGFLCVLAIAAVMFAASRKLGASPKSSLVIALVTTVFCGFIAREGIDPLALLLIAELVYLMDLGWPFYPLLAASTFANEKILIVIILVVGLRVLVGREWRESPRLIVCGAAFCSYVLVRSLVSVPGNENQLMPSTFMASVIEAIPELVSTKGFVTNAMPTLLMAILAVIAYRGIDRFHLRTRLARKSDVGVFVFLFGIGLATSVDFTLGRLVMFAFPLYLPVLALWLDEWLPDRTVTPEKAASA